MSIRDHRRWIPVACIAMVGLGNTSCEDTATPSSGLEITNGVESFGLREVTLNGPRAWVHLIRWGREGERFESRFTASYPSDDWSAIAASVDMDVLSALPADTPCDLEPCRATEWLEVRKGTRSKRLTFPAGASFPEIATFLQAVRSVRESVEQP